MPSAGRSSCEKGLTGRWPNLRGSAAKRLANTICVKSPGGWFCGVFQGGANFSQTVYGVTSRRPIRLPDPVAYPDVDWTLRRGFRNVASLTITWGVVGCV